MSKNTASIFLSYLLRHNPQKIGLKLDSEGWADVYEDCISEGDLEDWFPTGDVKFQEGLCNPWPRV